MAFAWEAANRGCPGGFKEGSKAPKTYYLRTKHTIFRKYGTKKPKNRPQKAKKRSAFLSPGETVEASKFGSRKAGGRPRGWWVEGKSQTFSH